MTAIHPVQAASRLHGPAVGPLHVAGRPDRHLARLLANRQALAGLSTEQASHGLPNAKASFAAMVRVEEEIAALYPSLYARLFPTWVSHTADAAHEPGAYNPACSICAAHRRAPIAA